MCPTYLIGPWKNSLVLLNSKRRVYIRLLSEAFLFDFDQFWFHFKGNKFEFKDDWGEQLVSKCSPVIVVYDMESDEIRVLEGVPDNLSAGQVSMRVTKWN